MLVLRACMVAAGATILLATAACRVDPTPTGPTAATAPMPPTAATAACDVAPVIPTFDVTGAAPSTGELVSISGALSSVRSTAATLEIEVAVPPSGEVVFTVGHSGVMELDSAIGAPVQVDYWQRQGFEGVARGLRVADDRGLVLLVDDGDYGPAITGVDLAPFIISQTDIYCRNRANEPGDLNNFTLDVTVDGATVAVLPGRTSDVVVDGHDYAVHALRSTSRHSEVIWTDAPYTYTSYAINRIGTG